MTTREKLRPGEVIWDGPEVVEADGALDRHTVRHQALLTESITRPDPDRMDAIRRALTRASGC
jgi:hypothetical protein